MSRTFNLTVDAFGDYASPDYTDPLEEPVIPRNRIEYYLSKIAANREKFIVNFSGESSDDPEESTAACDKTYAQIKAAYDAGYNIEAKYGDYVLHLVNVNNSRFVFSMHYYEQYGDEDVWRGVSACIYKNPVFPNYPNSNVYITLGGDI